MLNLVLLFQPLRQQMEQLDVTIGRDQVAERLKPLLNVVRTLAQRSELVNLIVSGPCVASNRSTQKRSTE